MRLLVRQARHDGGLGVASGWLTAHAARGTSVAMRLVENRAFEPREEAGAEPDAPAIFIGNGSGYAGLRGHLLARMHAGRHRNWLLFGERQRAHDGYCEAEVSNWLAAGKLERADFIYSRDQARRRYVQDALREAADPCATGSPTAPCSTSAAAPTAWPQASMPHWPTSWALPPSKT